VTSPDILAKATDWAGSTPAARNEIFNITNGDYFRWQHLWPRIAGMFHMETADPVPLSLAEYMADKGPLSQNPPPLRRDHAPSILCTGNFWLCWHRLPWEVFL